MIPEQVFNKYGKLIDSLNDIIVKSRTLLVDNVSTAKVDHLYAISIYFNIVYGYKAIVQLLKNKEDFIIESNNILRSMLESLFVIRYLSKNPADAVKRIKNNYTNYQSRRKLDVLKYDDLKQLRKHINEDEIEEIKEIANDQNKRTGIKKWANLADLSHYYHVVYDVLSVEAHTNLKSISSKLKRVENNTTFDRPNSPEDYDTCLVTTFIILMLVLETIEMIYKIGLEEDIKSLDKQFPQVIKDNG